MLIGSDVKLNSPSSLISQALAEILQYPDKARDALRVLLHLVSDTQSIVALEYAVNHNITARALQPQELFIFLLMRAARVRVSVYFRHRCQTPVLSRAPNPPPSPSPLGQPKLKSCLIIRFKNLRGSPSSREV